MRILALGLLLLLMTLAAACESKSGSDVTSELRIFNDDTSALLADGDTVGAITMTLNDTRHLRVMRDVTDSETGTVSTDVTSTADFNVTNTSVLAVSETAGSEGTITATAVGSSRINVVFREGDFSDDDNAAIDVTVVE